MLSLGRRCVMGTSASAPLVTVFVQLDATGRTPIGAVVGQELNTSLEPPPGAPRGWQCRAHLAEAMCAGPLDGLRELGTSAQIPTWTRGADAKLDRQQCY